MKKSGEKKKGGMLKKVLIVLVVLGIIGAIGGGGSGEKAPADNGAVESAESETPVQETAAEPEEVPEPSIADGIDIPEIADYFKAYNDISSSPFESVEQSGNYAYAGQSYGYEFNVSITPNGQVFTVFINDHGDYEGMRQAFCDGLAAMDPTLANEAGSIFDEAMPNLSFNGEDYIIERGQIHIDFSAANDYEEFGHVSFWKNS